MRDAATVTDDIQAGIAGFEPLVHLNLHVVELDLYAVEQRIVVGSAGGNLVERADHLNDVVQNALGKHEAEIAGRCIQRGRHEGALNAVRGGAAASDQIAEALHDHAAAQHIAESCDGFAVAVGILEWLGEMLCHQKRKVCVFGLLGGVLIAVAVHRNDAVGVFVYHGTLGIHAEGTHLVAVFFGAVNDLALVKLIGQMREYRRGQLHAHADVHAVGLGGNIEIAANALHPLASASSDGNDALFAGVGRILAFHSVAANHDLDRLYGRIKEEIHLVFKIGVEIFQNDVVDIRAEMADRSIQKVQIVLDAERLKSCACGGVELAARTAVAHIDLIYVVHKIQRVLFADIFVKRAAEVIGNVVFSVRKCARTAESAHDGAAFAADTGLDLFAVDWTVALMQRVSRLKHRNLQLRCTLHQLVSGKDAAGACTYNDNIVIHR